MRFADLGGLEVRDGDRRRVIGRRASLALAALLWSDRPVPAERLADIVWGDDQPADARESLHVLIWRLRRVLEPNRERGDSPTLLVSAPPGYALLARPHQIDSQHFEVLVGAAREQAPDDPSGALQRLDEGLGLWRGHPLGDIGYEEWALPTAARLLETRAAAQELRLDALARLGRHDEVAAETEQLVADHPTREGMWARRARSLYALGDQVNALAALRAARTYLAEELGLDPGPELVALECQILQHDPALTPPARPAAPAARAESLPRPRSSLHGRTDDVRRVREQVESARLVTLTGPGGVGKSRLAVEAALGLAPSFPGGTVFVDLTKIGRNRRVPVATARALGLEGGGAIGEHFAARRGTRVLLVLDNCEHVVAGVADLLQTLAPYENLHVLASSRCPIGSDGERVVVVEPLPVPEGDLRRAALRRFAAVQLLSERSVAAGADLDDDAATLSALAEVVAHLDGMPLGLELAAVSIGVVGLDGLLRCLESGWDVPEAPGAGRPARHRTLDTAVTSSFEQCEPGAQRLLQRLAVIPGPFDLETASHVGSGRPVRSRDLPRHLAELVHHSLVSSRTEAGGAVSYRMLEPIRRFAMRSAPTPATLSYARTRLAEMAATGAVVELQRAAR